MIHALDQQSLECFGACSFALTVRWEDPLWRKFPTEECEVTSAHVRSTML